MRKFESVTQWWLMKKFILLFFLLLTGCSGPTITHGTIIKKETSESIKGTHYYISIGREVPLRGHGTSKEITRTLEVDKETYDKYKMGEYYRRYPVRAEES
jgi:hypothetical protein